MNDLSISAENILDGLSEGVYVCDRDRRIVFWSKASERITGWQAADVMGRACHEDILDDIPEAAAYQAQTVTLTPGDAILMFSDGAFEIHNAGSEMLGVDGFIGILKDLNYPREPLNMTALKEALLTFSNDIRLQDDITILEARYLP